MWLWLMWHDISYMIYEYLYNKYEIHTVFWLIVAVTYSVAKLQAIATAFKATIYQKKVKIYFLLYKYI